MKTPVFYLLVATLLLFPPLLYTGAYFHHPKVKVGIVMDEGCESRQAEISREAFDLYPTCFEAEVLPTTFRLPSGDECYSNVVLDLADPVNIRKEFEVDIVILLINRSLVSSKEDDRDIGGKADTLTGAAIVSVSNFLSNSEYDRNRIKHITLHETFHLLGYLHDRWDRKCVMNIPRCREESRLTYFNEYQLPIRLWTYKLGIGRHFNQAAFITAFANFAVAIPYFIGVELVLYTTYKKSMNGKGIPFIWLLGALTGCALMMGTMFDAMWFIFGPLALMAFVHHYYYTYNKLKEEPLLPLV
jgi:hypothetical protein